jgi:large subunit ribosomal protein L24
MLKYKIGDKIKVLSGKDKGREGVIEQIFPKKNKALVAGINMYKKHIKKEQARDGKGGIYDLPRPIHLSKLGILDPKDKKITKVAFQAKGGKKLRIGKRTKTILDNIKTK